MKNRKQNSVKKPANQGAAAKQREPNKIGSERECGKVSNWRRLQRLALPPTSGARRGSLSGPFDLGYGRTSHSLRSEILDSRDLLGTPMSGEGIYSIRPWGVLASGCMVPAVGPSQRAIPRQVAVAPIPNRGARRPISWIDENWAISPDGGDGPLGTEPRAGQHWRRALPMASSHDRRQRPKSRKPNETAVLYRFSLRAEKPKATC